MGLLSASVILSLFIIYHFFFKLVIALCYFYLSGALKMNSVKMLMEGLGKLCVAGVTRTG